MKIIKEYNIYTDLKSELKGDEPSWIVNQLDVIEVDYIDFTGNIKNGKIICNSFISDKLIKIFKELLDIKFPIYSIIPISNFQWNDDISCRNNNSSCFNFRYISGTNKLSDHSKGLAIDINPVQNPWITKKLGILPSNSNGYDITEKGTITKEIVDIFNKLGFKWGGNWNNPDYQHFYIKI